MDNEREMSAGALLNALISYAMEQGDGPGRYGDILEHGLQIVRGIGPAEAREWLAEDLQERWIAMGD